MTFESNSNPFPNTLAGKNPLILLQKHNWVSNALCTDGSLASVHHNKLVTYYPRGVDPPLSQWFLMRTLQKKKKKERQKKNTYILFANLVLTNLSVCLKNRPITTLGLPRHMNYAGPTWLRTINNPNPFL